MNWKTKTLMIGAIVGSFTGLVAAYIIVQKAEGLETKPQISTGEGVKLGVGVLGLLRLVSDLVEGK